MHIANYLGLVHHSETNLADAFRQVSDAHGDEPDVHILCRTLAKQCDAHAEKLKPFVDRYGEKGEHEPDRLHSDLFTGTRQGGIGLLRDLHDLFLMATEVDISWVVLGQAAQGLQDKELLTTVQECDAETGVQLKWIKTRMKQSAPQALIVAS
jgi:hypothetical protein